MSGTRTVAYGGTAPGGPGSTCTWAASAPGRKSKVELSGSSGHGRRRFRIDTSPVAPAAEEGDGATRLPTSTDGHLPDSALARPSLKGRQRLPPLRPPLARPSPARLERATTSSFPSPARLERATTSSSLSRPSPASRPPVLKGRQRLPSPQTPSPRAHAPPRPSPARLERATTSSIPQAPLARPSVLKGRTARSPADLSRWSRPGRLARRLSMLAPPPPPPAWPRRGRARGR